MPNRLPSLRARLVSGGLWSLGGRLMFLLLTLVINALVARLLPPADVGTYFLAQSLVLALAALASLGLPQTIVRLLSEAVAANQRGRAADIAWKALVLVAASSALAALAWALGGGRWLSRLAFPESGLGTVALLFGAWLWASSVLAALTEAFRGLHDIRRANLVGSVLPALLGALGLAVIWGAGIEVDLDAVVLVIIAAASVAIGVGVVQLRRHLGSVPPCRETKFADLIRASFHIGIIGIATAVFGQCDIWIIGMLNSQEELAMYGAAARLAVMFPAPLLIANGVLAPIIAELYSQGDKCKLERILRTTTTVCSVPVAFLVLLAIGYGDFLTGLVYGDYYRDAGLLLCFLGVGQLVNVGVGASSLVLLMTGHQRVLMHATLVTGTFRLGMIYWLTSRYGVQGTAVAAAISLIVQSVVLLAITRSRVGIWTHAGMEGLKEMRQFLGSRQGSKA